MAETKRTETKAELDKIMEDYGGCREILLQLVRYKLCSETNETQIPVSNNKRQVGPSEVGECNINKYST